MKIEIWIENKQAQYIRLLQYVASFQVSCYYRTLSIIEITQVNNYLLLKTSYPVKEHICPDIFQVLREK